MDQSNFKVNDIVKLRSEIVTKTSWLGTGQVISIIQHTGPHIIVNVIDLSDKALYCDYQNFFEKVELTDLEKIIYGVKI